MRDFGKNISESLTLTIESEFDQSVCLCEDCNWLSFDKTGIFFFRLMEVVRQSGQNRFVRDGKLNFLSLIFQENDD